MKFNIDDYQGRYVMHCKTKEEAESFCKYLHSVGRKWATGESYVKLNIYDRYADKTAYEFNDGTYSSVDYYHYKAKLLYTILEWEDFMKHTFTKAELKTGDVVKQRNGLVGIVNRDLGMMITKDSWLDLDNICDDLKSGFCCESFDIVAVRRPEEKGDCQFKAFENEWGTLIYERKEPEEMTLAEVCKLLGREIKIIK